MAAHGPIHLASNNNHFGPQGPKVVVGFHAQKSAAHTDGEGGQGIQPARSLLSELLLRDDCQYEVASVSMDEEMDQSEGELDEFDEQWEWFSSQKTEQSCSTNGECDKSSQSSCPIPIPSLKSSAW